MAGSTPFYLHFTPSEVRLATVTLLGLTGLLPILYFFRTSYTTSRQESTPHVQTFRKFIKAYSTLRPQALISNATSTFTHTVLPSSLQLPSRTLEPFKQHAAMIFSLFEEFEMVVQEPPGVQFCAETNTVIAHCKMGGRVSGSGENGRKLIKQGVEEWWTECVLFVRMDREGRRVEEVREFVHSAKAEELKKRIMGVLES